MRIAKSRNDLPKDIIVKLDDANVFFTAEYEQYVLSRSEKLLYFWDDEFIICLRVKRVLFIQAGVFDSEPYAFYVGEDYLTKEQMFIDEICHELKSIGVAWILTAQSATFLSYPHNAVVVPRGNLICDLSLSEEEMFKKVHSKHRNSIRRAERNDVTVLYTREDIVELYASMEQETYDRSSKKGAGYEYYLNISRNFTECSDFAIAFKDNQPQAGGVFFYNRSMGYYMHGASVNNSEPGSANYLIWREMIKLKKQGVLRFNFVGYGLNVEEGSKYAGIQRFKERFGGELIHCYNFRYVSIPMLYSLYCLYMRLTSGEIKNHTKMH